MPIKRKASSELKRNSKISQISATISTTFLDVFDSDRRFPVHEQLWEALPLQSAIALSRTCRQMREGYLRIFNINQRLAYFVQDPIRLRSQLGKHGSLI